MPEYLTEVIAISSKGQLVLPKAIRDSLSLAAGTRLMVLSDGENILLKPIRKPDISEFRTVIDQAAQLAADVGMKEENVASAAQETRAEIRTCK